MQASSIRVHACYKWLGSSRRWSMTWHCPHVRSLPLPISELTPIVRDSAGPLWTSHAPTGLPASREKNPRALSSYKTSFFLLGRPLLARRAQHSPGTETSSLLPDVIAPPPSPSDRPNPIHPFSLPLLKRQSPHPCPWFYFGGPCPNSGHRHVPKHHSSGIRKGRVGSQEAMPGASGGGGRGQTQQHEGGEASVFSEPSRRGWAPKNAISYWISQQEAGSCHMRRPP